MADSKYTELIEPHDMPMGRFGFYTGSLVIRTFDGILNLSAPSVVMVAHQMTAKIGLLLELEREIGRYWPALTDDKVPVADPCELKDLPYCQFGRGLDDWDGSVFIRTPDGFVDLSETQSTWSNDCDILVKPLPSGTSILMRFKNGSAS